MANELPGFPTPDSPKAKERSFVRPGVPIDLLVQDNVPLSMPQPKFESFIEKSLGNQVDSLAIGDGAQTICRPGTNEGTKAYWLRIMPDELIVLHGTYLVRVTANDAEIYRTSLTVGYD